MNAMNLGAYGTDYDTRAAVAWLGLGALSKNDALYPDNGSCSAAQLGHGSELERVIQPAFERIG